MNLRDKISTRFQELEIKLRSGRHLAGDEGRAEMVTLLSSIAKFTSALDDDERDFVNAARLAIEKAVTWR